MVKKEDSDTLPVLPIGEDPLQMAERNKHTLLPKKENKIEPDTKRPKRKRIPK